MKQDSLYSSPSHLLLQLSKSNKFGLVQGCVLWTYTLQYQQPFDAEKRDLENYDRISFEETTLLPTYVDKNVISNAADSDLRT